MVVQLLELSPCEKASYRQTSHLQRIQRRQTLEEPLRQGSEGVVLQETLCDKGTRDEPRTDST